MPIPRRFIPSTDSYTTDQPCKVCLADINQRGVPLLRCMYSFKMKFEDESGKSLVARQWKGCCHISLGSASNKLLQEPDTTLCFTWGSLQYHWWERSFQYQNYPPKTHDRVLPCITLQLLLITDQPCEVCLADVTQHGVRLLHCMLLSGMPPTNFRSQLQWLHFPGNDFQSNQW